MTLGQKRNAPLNRELEERVIFILKNIMSEKNSDGGFFARDEKLVDECLDILTGR